MKLLNLFETNQEEYQIQNIADAILGSQFFRNLESYRANTVTNLEKLSQEELSEYNEIPVIEKLGNFLSKSELGMLYDVFKNVQIEWIFYVDPNKLPDFGGLWHQNVHGLEIPLSLTLSLTDQKVIAFLKRIIVHELRHGLDEIKSNNNAFNDNGYVQGNEKDLPGRDKNHLKYMRSTHEVNARFSELLSMVEEKIHEYVKTVNSNGDILDNSKPNRQVFRRNLMSELKPFIDEAGLGIYFKTNDHKEKRRRADAFYTKGTRSGEFNGRGGWESNYNQSKSFDDPRFRRLITRAYKYAEERADLIIKYRFSIGKILEDALSSLDTYRQKTIAEFDQEAKKLDLFDFEEFEMHNEVLTGPYLIEHQTDWNDLDESDKKYIVTCDKLGYIYLEFLHRKKQHLNKTFSRLQNFTKKQNIMDLDESFGKFANEHIHGTQDYMSTVSDICNFYVIDLMDYQEES